jgi:hemerythrin
MLINQWKDEMATGIHAIDEDLKRILVIMHSLSVDRAGHEPDHAVGAIQDLQSNFESSFKLEEELMEQANYIFLKAHRMIHNTLRKRLAEIRARAEQGIDVLPELHSFLDGYLQNHVMKSNKDYVEAVSAVYVAPEEDLLSGADVEKFMASTWKGM